MSHRGLVFRGIVGVSPLTCCTLALAATDLLRLLAGRWSTTATAAAFGEHRARWRPVVFTVARFTRSPRETAKPLPPPTDDEFSYRSRKKKLSQIDPNVGRLGLPPTYFKIFGAQLGHASRRTFSLQL